MHKNSHNWPSQHIIWLLKHSLEQNFHYKNFIEKHFFYFHSFKCILHLIRQVIQKKKVSLNICITFYTLEVYKRLKIFKI